MTKRIAVAVVPVLFGFAVWWATYATLRRMAPDAALGLHAFMGFAVALFACVGLGVHMEQSK